MPRSPLDTAGLTLSLLGIAVATLLPGPASDVRVVTLCLVCATNGAASAALNVALFAPFGFFLKRLGRPTWSVVRAGFLLSLGIELAQLFVVPGRETALGDLVANTTGVLVGAVLGWNARAWLRPRRRTARAAALIAAIGTATILTLTAMLLEPSAPPGDYWVQWNPEAPMGRTPGGEVIAADLDGAPLRMGRVPDPIEFRERVLAGATLHVRIVLREPAADPEPLFRIVTGGLNAGTNAFTLLAHREALVVLPRTRAEDRDLARPGLRLDDALASMRAGDTLDVRMMRVTGEGEGIRLGNGTLTVLGNTVGRGWGLVYTAPNHLFALRDAVDVAWLLGLAFVLGWYALAPWVAVAGGVPLLAVAWWAPRWTDLQLTPASEYVALVTGVALGWLARSIVERVHRREGVQTSWR